MISNAQAKQVELNDRMDLSSYLLKPVQRMGKYALLLAQITDECPVTHPDHADLKVFFLVLIWGVINDRCLDVNPGAIYIVRDTIVSCDVPVVQSQVSLLCCVSVQLRTSFKWSM